ncbi:MAG: ABC transporter permease [Dehalococcoidia bacterium]
MSGLQTAFVIARRRLKANLRLTSALVLGVVVAASLLASTSIYARAMADLGLTYAVRTRLPVAPVTTVLTYDQGYPVGSEAARAQQQAVANRIQARLGWFSSAYGHYVRMPPLRIGRQGDVTPPMKLPNTWVESLDGYESHVKVVAGTLPRAAQAGAQEFEVALSAGSASAGLHVGDHFQIVDVFDDCERHPPREGSPPDPPCTPVSTVVHKVPAVVTATIAPDDPNDPFWAEGTDNYFSGRPPYDGAPPGAAIFVPSGSMNGAFGALFPNYFASQQWYAYANPVKLTRQNYKRAQAELAALNDDLLGAGLLTVSTLRSALESFNSALSYNQAPLLILLLQITGIALFYVGIVAAMTVERQQQEIALLRSRGASARQVLLVYVLEGLGLAIPATLLGPFLGAGYTRLLGYTPVFRPVTGGSAIPTYIVPSTFALAGLGALLAVIALLLPALVASRFNGVTQRRQVGRPPPSMLQQYFLDYGLLVICAVLLWELHASGSVFKAGTAGGLATDPLLLLAPALLTVSLGVLVLRLYPLVLRIAARIFAAGRGVTAVLGLWQMTRNPAQYTRLGLLLMMGIAVGAFAASYSDTTNRSYRERALYQAGVDVRGSIPPFKHVTGSGPETDALFQKLPGVAQASSAVRVGAEVAAAGTNRIQIQVLGIDPAAGRSMLWYRPGLSHDSLDTLMADLGSTEQQIGKPVPGEPVSFSLWANPVIQREGLTAWARFRDAGGHYQMYELGKLDFTGWQQMTARLNTVGTRPLFPISLVSIVLTQGVSALAGKGDPIYFDDFTVAAADGHSDLIEDFENSSSWTAAPLPGSDQDEAVASTDAHHGGARSLRYTLRPGVLTDSRGFYVTDPYVPLPGVISRDVASQTGAGVGSVVNLNFGGHIVPVKVQGIADLFPTLDPTFSPFVLLNRSHLLEWLPHMTDSTLDNVNEVWLKPQSGADHAALLRRLQTSPTQLETVLDASASQRQDHDDPLVAAGGSGILLISFIASLVMIAGAFAVSLYTAVTRRRVEFAVMKALGLGRGRIAAMLGIEYGIISLIGAATGLALGLAISRIMLSFLDVTDSGAHVQPPFVLVTNWSMIAAAFGCLAAIVLVGILVAVRTFASGGETAALRITE